MNHNQTFRDKDGAKREAIAEQVGGTPVYLSRNRSGRVSDSLLDADGRGSSILTLSVS